MTTNADQHEDVFEDRDHAGGEHFVQRVHVGGDARDQAADRVAVEEADMHALQVAEDLAAQVEHHLLPGPLHQVGLGEFQHEAEDQQNEIDAADLADAGPGLRAQPAVQKGCGLPCAARYLSTATLVRYGPKHVSARLQHDGGHRDRPPGPVGTQVGQQALHQPGCRTPLPNTSSSWVEAMVQINCSGALKRAIRRESSGRGIMVWEAILAARTRPKAPRSLVHPSRVRWLAIVTGCFSTMALVGSVTGSPLSPAP